MQAVTTRLEGGATVTGIHDLGYNFYTGLIHVFFEFTPTGGVALTRDAILVIFDSEQQVVGIVDPFDPDQPNRFIPSLPQRGEQPFVLARPQSAEGLFFSPQALYPRDVADREFFRKLQMRPTIGQPRILLFDEGDDGPIEDGGGGGDSGGGDGGDGGGGTGTECGYSTSYQTLIGSAGTAKGPVLITGTNDVDDEPSYEADGRADYLQDD
jgi:hypothetical protein